MSAPTILYQASNLGSLRARPVGLDFYRLLEGITASMQGTKATDIQHNFNIKMMR